MMLGPDTLFLVKSWNVFIKLPVMLFFLNSNPKQIHLCCGDQSLGSCEVPWSSMLRPNSDAINRQPLIIEGSFHLNPPLQVRGVLPPGDNTACVGASVVLRREEIPIQPVIPKVWRKSVPHMGNQHGLEEEDFKESAIRRIVYIVHHVSRQNLLTHRHASSHTILILTLQSIFRVEVCIYL